MTPFPNPHLERWHKIVSGRDLQGLQAMLAEDVVFRSPYMWEPYHGIDLIKLNDANLIADFEVFVRPASSLRELGLKMARRLR